MNAPSVDAAQHLQGQDGLSFSPGLVDVRALAGGAGGGRLGQGSRVQDPLWPSVHRRLLANRKNVISFRSVSTFRDLNLSSQGTNRRH